MSVSVDSRMMNEKVSMQYQKAKVEAKDKRPIKVKAKAKEGQVSSKP